MLRSALLRRSARLALLLAGCSAQAKAPPPPPPAAVDVAPVQVRALRQWDDFTGRLEAVQSVEVRPRVGGYVDSASLPEGAHVRRGQLLFQIDPRPFQAEVARLAAEAQRARADAALAQADAGRAQRLLSEQAIAQGEFDRQDSRTKAAAAGVAAADAALQAARLNLSFTRVVSPIDGVVSKALITRGNLVTPQSLLTTVVSDGPIYAGFNADEQTYLKYARDQRGKGGPVYVGLMTEPGFPHAGRLQFLDNAVDGRSGTINARALLPNADGRLTPGLFARVRLVSAASQTVALAPEEALGSDLGRRFVLVLDPTDHVQYRAVTLGPAIGPLHVVRDGLQAGDQVVTAGLGKVRPGDKVTPRRTAAPDPGPALSAELAPAA